LLHWPHAIRPDQSARCQPGGGKFAFFGVCVYELASACVPADGVSNMLLNVVITLIIVGVLLWLVNTYLPMDAKIKSILNIVIVIAVVLWLLRSFGVVSALG
jgi:hypothetical protein